MLPMEESKKNLRSNLDFSSEIGSNFFLSKFGCTREKN